MKKLENEYRQLMQNETPDLWSRIEAGIDAKIAEDAIKNVVEFTEKKSVHKEKVGVNLWKKYSLPLVACIAAIICVPLLLTGFIRMASGGNTESAMLTEMAADTAADCAAPEETTSVTMDSADEPTAAVVTEGAYDEELLMEDSVAETTEEELTESVAQSEVAEDNKQSVEDLAGAKQVLTVTQISQSTEESGENREKGTVYYLTTEEAGECTLFVPADAQFEFDMEIQLKIQVEPGNEEYDFVFVEIVE